MEIVKDKFCIILDSLSKEAKEGFDFFCSELQRIADEYELLNKVDKLEVVCLGTMYRDIIVSAGKVNEKEDEEGVYYFFASCAMLSSAKERVTQTIQHELMHIKDMVDKEFKFNNRIWKELRKDNKLSGLIPCIWNIYVDSRIAKMKKIGISKAQRSDEFLYASRQLNLEINRKEIGNIFERLWNIEKIDFPTIINKAKELSRMKRE